MAKNRVTVKKSMTKQYRDKLRSSRAVVGLPKSSATYEDGTSVVQVGIDHEFGSETARTYTSSRGNVVSVSGIPERSFMRSTAKEKRSEWAEKVGNQLRAAIKGQRPIEKVLSRVGRIAAEDIKLKILSINSPANSPQVVADKGSSNPLIDTGHMLGQITHEVRS